MATSITHVNVKPRVGIPSATSTFDTEIDNICTAVGAAVDAYVASSYLTSDAAVVKEAAIMIASGTVILSMAKRPGWGEAITASGLSLGSLGVDGGSDMVKLGWELLKPFTDSGNAEELAKQAEAVRQKLLSEARYDEVDAQVDAELLKLENEAAKLGSEKSKLDAEELKTDAETSLLGAQATTEGEVALKTSAETSKIEAETAKVTAETTTEGSVKRKTDAETAKLDAEELLVDAQTATETQKPVKVLADAAMSTAMAAESQARADLNTARKVQLDAANTSLSDETELPLEDHSYRDSYFDVDSQEYDL